MFDGCDFEDFSDDVRDARKYVDGPIEGIGRTLAVKAAALGVIYGAGFLIDLVAPGAGTGLAFKVSSTLI